MFESLPYFRTDCKEGQKDLEGREPIDLIGFPWVGKPTGDEWYVIDNSAETCLRVHSTIGIIGASCASIFFVEFVCRIISHPYYLFYAITPWGIIDMLAIFPTLVLFIWRRVGEFDGNR